MEKKKTLAVAGVGIAAAATLGLAGASLASAADTSVVGVADYGQAPPASGEGASGATPDRAKGMRDGGGTLTADAASKAVSAALAEVSGGTANGVRALSDGTYVVEVHQSDDTHVRVLVDASFAVTSVEEGGMRGPGRGHGTPEGVPSAPSAPAESGSGTAPDDATGPPATPSPST